MIESYMGPTARFAGSNTERQSVGLPGHCIACAEHGHVTAHPDLGCGDVGCTATHDETLERAVRETVAAIPPIPDDVRDEIARLLTRAWSDGQAPA